MFHVKHGFRLRLVTELAFTAPSMGPWSAHGGVKGSHHGPSSSLRLRLGSPEK